MEKIVLALGLAVLVATSVYLSQENSQVQENEIRMIYNMWKEQQGRKYGSSENEFRFNVFKSNYDIVLANNIKFELGLESVELNMNQFADLTNEEFQARYLNLQQKRSPMRGSNRQVFTGENVEIPTSVDWRTSGAVNAVKNQGSCGSCWAFSAVAAIEGALKLSTGTLYNLSEQELVDCAGGVYGNEGCNGGWMDEAFQYVIDNGITTQSSYPYTGKDGSCRYTTPRVGISSFVDVDELSESALLAAIAQQPVSVAINAGGIFFQLYSKGVFTNACAGGADKLNHGVVAVGYGNESSKDYYLVRNSWGSTWGEAGYIKLVRKGDGDGQCGIQDAPSYPIDLVEIIQ